MAETTYTYSVAADTATGVLNSSLLSQEIQDSSMTQPAKDDLSGINTSGDVLQIVFLNAISTGAGSDKEKLDAVVLAHTGATTTTDTQRAQDFATVQTNATTTWQNALSLVCPPLVAGVWAVDVRCELRLQNEADFSSGGPDRAADARLTIDGANRANWLTPWQDFDNKQASDVLSFVEGDTPTLNLDFRRRGTDTAEVTRCIINLTFIGT